MPIRLVFAALLLTCSPALAAAGSKPWINGFVSGANYSMSRVNADIRGLNTSIASSGLKMDEITRGAGFGLAVASNVRGAFSFGVGYERLAASTRASGASLATEYTLPADLFRGLCRYSFAPVDRSGAFVEASLGHVSTSGSFKATSGEFGLGGNVEGSGVALELDAGGQLWTSPVMALSGSLGYRHAVVVKPTLGGETMRNADGSGYQIDYTGAVVRAGVTLALWE